MPISAQDVKNLRDTTGAGMMDAKRALEEANGDEKLAAEILRKKGMAKASKKAGRETGEGLVDSYVHMGRVGTLIEVACETDFVARTEDFKAFVHDMAMQVAASSPEYVSSEDVPKDVLAKERELFAGEMKEQGKPANVIDKIVEGKIEKYFVEVCLLNQPFLKDPEKSVQDVLNELIGKLGENIVIKRFSRIELGE